MQQDQTSAEMVAYVSTIFYHLCKAPLTSAVAVIFKKIRLFTESVRAIPVLDRLVFLSARLTKFAV